MKELESRWDYDDPAYRNDISESFPIDQSKHSLFAASKAEADVMVQEKGTLGSSALSQQTQYPH